MASGIRLEKNFAPWLPPNTSKLKGLLLKLLFFLFEGFDVISDEITSY